LLFEVASVVKASRSKTSKREKNDAFSHGGGTQPGANIDALRQQIGRLVADDALEMVGATIEQVKSGQYQALKYLFEMVGLYPASNQEETPQQDSLAKILLNRLGIPPLPGPAMEKASRPALPDAVE
jgi:hypothetical protein